MTREEAVERIKDHMVVHKLFEERAIKITEALEMAISALEQPEPCKDAAVSRQAAIDVFDGVKVDEEDCTEYDIGYNDGIDFAVSKLSVLPSAQSVARDTNVLSNDLIIRQEAIDALKGLEFCHYMEFGEYIGEDTREVRLIRAEKAQDALQNLPSAQPDGIPLEWINKHLEWLDNCDNDFAQLAKVSIRAMVECYGRKTGFNKQTGGD